LIGFFGVLNLLVMVGSAAALGFCGYFIVCERDMTLTEE
jgi:hypothetical protein